MKKLIITTLAAFAGLLGSMVSHAGGSLDTLDFSNAESLIGDNAVVGVTPIKWDPRCSSIEYTLDTIAPNAGTEQEISLEDTRRELQIAFDCQFSN